MTEAARLWRQLEGAGLVSGEMPPQPAYTPWFVRLIQGIAGWLAAWCVLGILGLMLAPVVHSLFEEGAEGVAGTLGVLLLFSAWRLLRGEPQDFREQAGLAVSLAGQVLLATALHDWWRDSLTWLGWGVLQAGLAWHMPHAVHRLTSAFIACLSLTAALAKTALIWFTPSLAVMIMAALWLSENRWFLYGHRIRPWAYAVTLALLCLHGFSLFSLQEGAGLAVDGPLHPPVPGTHRVNEGMMILAWVGTVWTLMQRNGVSGVSLRGCAILSGALLVSAFNHAAPGFAVAWLILILGFAGGNKVLLGLGFAAFWIYLGRFYYLLDSTLLLKGGAMMTIGLLLLCARLILRRMPGGEVHEH